MPKFRGTGITRDEVSRREILKATVTAGGLAMFGFHHLHSPLLIGQSEDDAFPKGRFLGQVPFIYEGNAPLGVATGEGLDGRLFTDLSEVGPDRPTIPNDRFYLRTRGSDFLNYQEPWQVKLTATGKKTATISIETVRKLSQPAGLHLMECSGNVRAARFGMLSVADWSGAPVSEMLDLVGIQKTSKRVFISGFDEYPEPSETSQPGASWIFTVDELIAAKAFFAVTMNGAELSRDHGAPVRLVVPGWYGCTCIKWVNDIRVVDDDAPSTSQMREFAGRTMQVGVPELAKEYRPARIEQAAMPVRVEKWSVDGKIQYRVYGIAWGGWRLCHGLEIRFNADEHFVRIDRFRQPSNDPWSFWAHAWTPVKRGTYDLQLRLADDTVPAIRLNKGYYVRSVEITEI